MLSLLFFDYLNSVFAHICLHKSLITFAAIAVHIPFIFTMREREEPQTPLSLSLPKVPLKLIRLQMYLGWITQGGKKWICRHTGSGILRQQ